MTDQDGGELEALTALIVSDGWDVFVEHDAASLSSGVVAFGSGSDQFQGPLSVAATITLPPGGRFLLSLPTVAGWTVDATHKTLCIVNSDMTDAATVRLAVLGSV